VIGQKENDLSADLKKIIVPD